ncbi:MAG: glycosyltransferase family 87 protein, partial [Candidatus Methanomethylophilus sp.]|nr:glycosyltransferase family 87 protein [Methanomethylophilus sp.]
MNTRSICAQPLFAVGTAIVFLLMIVFLLADFVGSGLGEVQLNYRVYGEAMLNGYAPYTVTNGLSWEYPPLAFVFMLVPALFSTEPSLYQLYYCLMIAMFAVLGLWLIIKTAQVLGYNQKIAAILYLVLTAMMTRFVFDRYDFFPAVMTLAAFYLLITDRRTAALTVLAVATLTKVYPSIFILVFLTPALAKHDWRQAGRGLAVYLGACVLICLPFLALAGGDFMEFVTYHTGRLIQLESTAAGALMLLGAGGLTDVWTVSSSGSFNIAGPLADALNGVILPITAAAVVAVSLLTIVQYRRREMTAVDLLMPMCCILLTFIVFNKVFSAQYLIWIIPLAALVLAGPHSARPGRLTATTALVAAFAISACLFLIYDGLCYQNPLCVLLLVFRNLLLIGLFICTVRSIYCDQTQPP